MKWKKKIVWIQDVQLWILHAYWHGRKKNVSRPLFSECH